jgi:type II secretory pathway pseudopilin PulG
MKTKNIRGVSLIESVVTLGVVMLLITGLVVGMTASLNNAQESKSRSLAVQYAQEALEIMRQERDTSWTTFAARGAQINYCMGGTGQLSTPVAGVCPIFTGTFSRKLTFTLVDPKQMDVVVIVSWIEGNSAKNVSLQTKYTQWK